MNRSPLLPALAGGRRRGTRSNAVALVVALCITIMTVYVAVLVFTGPQLQLLQQSRHHMRASLTRRALVENTPPQQEVVAQDPVAAPTLEQQFSEFWASPLPTSLHTLQLLRQQISMAKCQRLLKDVEPQDMAGLDIAMADVLQQLGSQSQLHDTQAWLRRQVTTAVFRALSKLQHPKDCKAAPKLLCDFNKPCGFGCQVHHAVHCFTTAIALNRTMVLRVEPWNYSPGLPGSATWASIMQPVSSCTVEHLSKQVAQLPRITSGVWHQQELEVALDIVDNAQTSLEPPAMPPDLLDVAVLFVRRPEQWWTGVLSSYLLRPSAETVELQQHFKHTNLWASPIVGVHVRRTDKLQSEAKLHAVAEYMSQVELFCDLKLGSGWQQRALAAAAQQSTAGTVAAGDAAAAQSTGAVAAQRTAPVASAEEPSAATGPAGNNASVVAPVPACSVYLATDEPSVVEEVKSQYGRHIQVLTNPIGALTGTVSARYSKAGAAGVYHDVTLLAATDFIVGTFSSQVSRLAYEVALVNSSSSADASPDSSLHYHSVDSMWYFGGMNHYEWCARHDYTVKGIAQFKAGQRLLCGAMHEFDNGLLKYSLLNEAGQPLRQVRVPPGVLGHCSTPSPARQYRNLLPQYMQRPQQQPPQAAAAAAATGVQAQQQQPATSTTKQQ